MARTRKQPKGRLVTTRRSYRNKAGAELIEPNDLFERNTVVTRRMSTIREHARKRRMQEENQDKAQKRARTAEPIDAEQAFFKCPLCTGTLGNGMKEFMNHLVEGHHVNPQRYVERCLDRTTIFKKIESEDPEMTGDDLVIATITRDEFVELREAMITDRNTTMQCSKARYNLMVEKKREERKKIGNDISTLFVTGGSNRDERVRIVKTRTLEQEDEQRSVLAWAARFVNDVKGKRWWLGRLPTKGVIDFEGDRENLLCLAKELTACTELEGEEMPVDELAYWYKCKLCIYQGQVGDLYRGSTLFAQHVTRDHKISMGFYVTKFIRSQEIFREHKCGKENCRHAGLIRAVNAGEEHL